MSNIDMNKNSENGSSNYTGDDKFVIKNLNLHYGDFHALKNINMNIPKNQFAGQTLRVLRLMVKYTLTEPIYLQRWTT